MVRFLSDEWLRALDREAGDSDALRQAARGTVLVVQEEVPGAPGDEDRYYISVDHGSVTFHRGEHTDPDVTFRQPYDTAVAVGRNETSAQAAFMVGKITATGRLDRLTDSAASLEKLHDVFLTVRSQTEY